MYSTTVIRSAETLSRLHPFTHPCMCACAPARTCHAHVPVGSRLAAHRSACTLWHGSLASAQCLDTTVMVSGTAKKKLRGVRVELQIDSWTHQAQVTSIHFRNAEERDLSLD